MANPTIVVIEDAPRVQALIGQVLEPVHARVVAAGDGNSGWEQVKALLPDLVILDLALPGINGWEVLQMMRADPETADIPIVVITAHGQSHMAGEVRRGGPAAFFEKPFHPGDLRACIAEILGENAA